MSDKTMNIGHLSHHTRLSRRGEASAVISAGAADAASVASAPESHVGAHGRAPLWDLFLGQVSSANEARSDNLTDVIGRKYHGKQFSTENS